MVSEMVSCGNNNKAISCAQCIHFHTVENEEWCGGDCRLVINQNTFIQECESGRLQWFSCFTSGPFESPTYMKKYDSIAYHFKKRFQNTLLS